MSSAQHWNCILCLPATRPRGKHADGEKGLDQEQNPGDPTDNSVGARLGVPQGHELGPTSEV